MRTVSFLYYPSSDPGTVPLLIRAATRRTFLLRSVGFSQLHMPVHVPKLSQIFLVSKASGSSEAVNSFVADIKSARILLDAPPRRPPQKRKTAKAEPTITLPSKRSKKQEVHRNNS
jgi:hypothetical protein